MVPPPWAYQVEYFVNEPDEELLCSICRAVFCDPVICPCDHVFCRACINKWLQSNRNCPICRKRVSNSSVKQSVPVVKNIIMKLLVNCRNRVLGCTAQFSVESSETHIKECEYELVQCKNKPCKDKLFRKDITEHETSDCPHRSIKCKTCGLKIPTSELPENHNCIRALQVRLKERNDIILRKINKIKMLKDEIKALKSAAQSSENSSSSTSRSFAELASSLSPEEIMINITEMESSSSSPTSDSEESSDDSIIIFTGRHSDNGGSSDSFFTFMDSQDSIEYSRNESPNYQGFSEYRNAESQTAFDFPLSDQQNSFYSDRNDNENLETSPLSQHIAMLCDSGERSRSSRPVKRRPTTQKPAKRRLPLSASSPDVGEPSQSSQPQTSRTCSRRAFLKTSRDAIESTPDDNLRSSMEAGPSCLLENSEEPRWSCLNGKKRSKPTNNFGECSESAVTVPTSCNNSMFERTRALLEQYSLESDPEWLPEYACHRGDTTSDSDISCGEAEFVSGESSTSVLSDEDNSNENQSNALSDLVNCSFNTTSDEDDPDWNPLDYLENKYNI